MKKIAIEINDKFFNPEAYAYKNYLSKNNFKVNFFKKNNNFIDCDLIIKFMGIDMGTNFKNMIVIHDYASLSTPPFPRIKNFIKKSINNKPDARIFLNENVKSEMNFKDDIPYIFRDMGIDNGFFSTNNLNKKYDIIYCGSFFRRPGLIEIIGELAIKKLNIALIGNISNSQKMILKDFKNIKFFGSLHRKQIYDIYNQSKIGLNFTPDIYPYNIQTSTKVLEYVASGLGILTNSYSWINNFEKKYNSNFLFYNHSLTIDDILNFNYLSPKLEDYEWSKMLNNIKFADFINNLF